MKVLKATQGILLSLFTICATTNAVYAKDTRDKIKDTVDQIADSIKSGIENLGDDLDAIQNYLENFSWNGQIHDKASSGAVTLSNLRLNGHDKVAVVHPGSKIDAEVICFADESKVKDLSVYRVVVGFADTGPQTAIYNSLGFSSQDKVEKFTLTAPENPGVYQVRFKTVHSLFEFQAVHDWNDEDGNGPDATHTLGVVVVR